MKRFIDNLVSVKSEKDFNNIKLHYQQKQRILIHCQDCGIPLVKILHKVINKPFDKLYCRKCGIINGTYEKYGVINVFQLNETKDTIKQTCIEKYGTEYISQSEVFKEQVKNTIKQKYGVEYITQTKNMKEKSLQTRLFKNDGKYKSVDEIIKTKNTFKKRYGCNGNLDRKEIKEKADKTQQIKYSNCFIKSESFKEMMLNKYGNVNPDYVHELVSKMHRRYKYYNKTFDSSWELAFYIWLQDNKIDFEYHNGLKFEYTFKGTKHTYWPDFKVGDEIVEIKSPILYEKMLIENTVDNSKFLCMKEHNVKIITDCTKYLDYISIKYGSNYLKQFKIHK